MKKTINTAGFTLVEAIVSMVLASILIAACSGFVINGIDITGEIERRSAASTLADTIITEMMNALKLSYDISIDGESLIFSGSVYGKDARLSFDIDGCLHIYSELFENDIMPLPKESYAGFTADVSGLSAEECVFGGCHIKGILTLSHNGRAVKKLDFNVYTDIG
jgi:type II secretory pathway pseudopilin PulG